VAFLFSRRGTTKLEAKDFIYDPATELGWFTLSESKKLLQAAKKSGFVKESEGHVEITFDYRSVDFPIGFKPSKKVLEIGKKMPLFPSMLSEAIKNGDISRSDLMAAVNKKQDEMNLEIEVALLLVCDEKGIEMPSKKRFIAAIRKKIRGISA